MKTLQELLALKHQRAERVKALTGIMEGANGITARDLTDAEQNEITEIRNGADALETQIRNAQFIADQKAADAARQFEDRINAGLDPGTGGKETPEDQVMKRFSISRAVQGLVNGKLTGAEAEADAIGRADAIKSGVSPGKGLFIRTASSSDLVDRADAATALAAKNLIPTAQMTTMEGYRPNLPIEALGATVMRNLVGVNNIPVADFLASAEYVGEAGTVPAIDVNVRKAELVAKQVCAKLPITMLLQAQAGSEIDRIAMKALEYAEGIAVTKGVISGSSPAPQGILGNTNVPNLDLATSGAMTFAQLLKMKNNPGKNDALFIEGERGWLTNDNIREQLEALGHGTSGRYVWDYDKPDMLLGHKAATTTLVPSNGGAGTNESAIIYGIWANLFVANWAFRRLVIDEVTVPGKTLLNWYSFWDHAIASPKAFAKCRNVIAV